MGEASGELAPPFPLPINGGTVLTCLRPHLHGWPRLCQLTRGVPLNTPWGTAVEAGSAEERGNPCSGWGTEAVKVLGREKTWVRPSPQTLNPFPTSRPLLLQCHLPYFPGPFCFSYWVQKAQDKAPFHVPPLGSHNSPPVHALQPWSLSWSLFMFLTPISC